jgi:soluble lytic murein transglycosylase-like protein
MLDLFIPMILTCAASGASAEDRQLCERVMTLQPRVDVRWALFFSQTLNSLAKRYQMDPNLSLAIAMQESSLDPNAVSSTGDSGIFQVYPSTAKAYGIDLKRLKHDIPYSIEQHLRILKDKVSMCPGKRAWSCYHSKTERHRRKYEPLVMRYMFNKG